MKRLVCLVMLVGLATLAGCFILDDPILPQSWVISGGVMPSEPLVVDDDIQVWVNGALVFSDVDGAWTGDSRGTYKGEPISLEADPNGLIRVEVSDTCCCQALIGPLFLHGEDGNMAVLTEGVIAESKGACEVGVHDTACLDIFFELEVRLSQLDFVPSLQAVHVERMTPDDDGDTVDFSPSVLGKTTVRYTGIDTPELAHGTAVLQDECFAQEARLRNEQLVSDHDVWLELDIRTVGGQQRLLAYVRVAPSLALESMVNYRLVSEGYARIFKVVENWRYVDDFRDAQLEAARLQRGMWGQSVSCAPYSSSDVIIAAVQYWERDGDEFVVILNRGTAPVDLAGWTLENGDGDSFEFPPISVLEPWTAIAGTSLSIRTVHSGPGSNQAIGGDLNWGNAKRWPDEEGVAVLKNASGEVVHEYRYRGF